LLGHWAVRGVAMLDAKARLVEAFECVTPADRDQRWHDRVKSIPDMLGYIWSKEGEKRDQWANTKGGALMAQSEIICRETEDAARDEAAKPNGGGKHQFRLIRFSAIKLDAAPAYVVGSLIPREGLILAWGPPKCGKTFWVFDLVMHVALGWEYRSRRVDPGTVVYIACEGERGLAARAEAFRLAKMAEDFVDPPFFLLTTRLDLPTQVDTLILDIAAQIPSTPCRVIVLDTLNRSIRGSESSDEDMSAYVAAADTLRDRFKCAVIIIHHCGIDASRPRGHTSLTGAVEAQIAVKRDASGRIIATVEWMKDGPEGDQIVSRLDVIEVGNDEDGEAVTSCVVEAVDGEPQQQVAVRRFSPKDQIALDALRKAIAEAGESAPANNHVPEHIPGVGMEVWRRYYLLSTASDGRTQDARWKGFQRSRESLQARHAIGIWEDFVWTT
jgi:hypothetical protein